MKLPADRLAHCRGRVALAALALALAGCGHMMHGRHGHAAGMAGHDGAMGGCCCMAGGQGMPQAGMQHGGMAQSQAAAAGTPAAPGQGASRLLPQQMAAAGPMCGSGGSSCCGCCGGMGGGSMGGGGMGGGSAGPSGGGMGGGAGTAK